VYLQQQAQKNGFKILVMGNNDQFGWSCWSENLCAAGAPAANSEFWVISCSGDAKNYNYPQLTKDISDVATKYASIKVHAACNDGDDQYVFWAAGIPAFEIDEYSWDNNPHYDDTGDDTMNHIDMSYLTRIAQVAITYEAMRVGLSN
jgi:hypothetical protein